MDVLRDVFKQDETRIVEKAKGQMMTHLQSNSVDLGAHLVHRHLFAMNLRLPPKV